MPPAPRLAHLHLVRHHLHLAHLHLARLRRRPPASFVPYAKVQIVTAHESIDGAKVDSPPSMQTVKRFRKSQQELEV